jgi:hypothetical protein
MARSIRHIGSRMLVAFLAGAAVLAAILWLWLGQPPPAAGPPVSRRSLVADLPVPVPPDEVATARRLMQGLPAEPNLRRALRQRLAGGDLGRWVRDVGALAFQGISDRMPDPSDASWLLWSFRQNICVLRIIQEGRRNPEVGPLVVADLLRRARAWDDTSRAARAAVARGEIGHTEAIDGSTADQPRNAVGVFGHDRYGIPAAAFILMNIDYYDEEAFASWDWQMGLRSTLDLDWTFLGTYAALLVQRSVDPRLEPLKRPIRDRLGDQLTEEITAFAPGAYWDDTHPLAAAGVVDLTQEPRLRLRVPAGPAMQDPAQPADASVVQAVAKWLNNGKP